MLLIADPEDDQALAALTMSAWNEWARAVHYCASIRSDLVQLQSLDVAEEIVEEWEAAGLVQRLPFGNLRMLGRGSLWDI